MITIITKKWDLHLLETYLLDLVLALALINNQLQL